MSAASGAPGAPRPARRAVIVSEHWNSDTEEAGVVRLLAGALSRHAEVVVVHIAATHREVLHREDSVFQVVQVPLVGARPLARSVMRVALGRGGAAHPPPGAVGVLEAEVGWARAVPAVLASLAPEVVVLAGHLQPFDHRVLGERGGAPRVVFCPLTCDPGELERPAVGELLARADAVGAVHPGEERLFAGRLEDGAARVHALDVALTLNRPATEQGLFGVGWFGRYVVLLRRFPEDAPRFERAVTHELLQRVIGRIAVAEVDGRKWRVGDAINTAELPVNPTRVNLWRLMANALVTVDARPATFFGREALESMLLATPVVVPEESAAMEHAAAASGGLWYRDPGELLDMTRALTSEGSLRHHLGHQGRHYAEAHHGNMDEFVARTGRIVFGEAVA